VQIYKDETRLAMKISIVILTLAAVFSTAINAQNLSYREIPTRQGVKQRFVYQKATEPLASAVLFQGGPGAIGAFGSVEKAWVKRDGAFLSGGAGRFGETGISAAVVDTPSDKSDLNNGFRSSPEHAQDISAVMAFLRSEAPDRPVCLVGTSNGSLSVTSAAALLSDKGPDCIVLTSSVSIKPTSSLVARFLHVFTDADLSKIKVPVLIVHHKHDSCKHTPYEPMPDYVKAFPNSPKVDFVTIEGGQDHSDSCNRGHHQFLGIEREVTAQISHWIKSLPK
jgi:pimeloyl-ACP methyl ester carboxylesterase